MGGHAGLRDGWQLWRWFQVRGAGFPLQRILKLATPGLEWDAAQVHVRQEIRAVASDSLFREAVTWQNRKAVTDGLDSLLRASPDAADARTRRKQLTVVSYLQRYCTKNDTIGFFGPIGWGRMVDEGALQCVVGNSLVRKRTTYFEPWAIRTLARVFDAAPQARIFIAPRMAPALRVQDGKLFGVAGTRAADGGERISPKEEALLSACNGEQPAWALADHFARAFGQDADDIYEALASYADRGWVWWGFDVAAEAFPEHRLQAAFDSLGDDDVRASAQECLADLVGARDAVSQAAGTPELGTRIAALEECFTSITGSAASRNEGQTYAGRALLYEDCVRDVDLSVGPVIRERLAAPLALVLASARWFTHQIGRQCFQLFAKTVRNFGGDVDFTRFWHAVGPYLADFTPPMFAEATRGLQARWASVLDGATQVRSEDLRARVSSLFAAPHPGWPSARHHCPDVMVCSPSVAEVGRGNFALLLGELHAGLCVFSTLSASMQHPDVAQLQDAYAADIGPGIAPVAVDNFARSSHDSRLAVDDIHMETVPDVPSWRPRSQVVQMSQLRIRFNGGQLRVDGPQGQSWDVMQVMERPLKTRAAVAFSPFPSSGQRITIDDVVMARRRWSMADLDFSALEDARERFVRARHWAVAHQLPRFVFIKVPSEVKPCFVDLENVALVELMCRMAKGEPSMTVSEMLPTPDQCWLPSPAGGVCTSELRLVAVDPIPFQPFVVE